MSAVLRLESFSARIAVAPPPITTEHLAHARGEGFAAGLEAGADAAAAAVAAAIQALTAALSEAEANRAGRDAMARREMAALLRAVIGRLAPPLRAGVVAERVVAELAALDAAAPEAARIRCEAGLVAPVRQALATAGIAGVEVAAGEGPLEVTLPGGALRIDMAGLETALDRLVAEIAEGES